MRMRMLTATAAAGLVLLTGCGAGAPSDTSAGGAPASEKRTLTVLAAVSLTDTFGELEKQFETDNPGVDVVMSYGGSSNLAQQIVNGAPVDVFVSASDPTMKTVTDAGLANGSPTTFATNMLEIATVPGNPKGITSFVDLANRDLKVVVCAPQVPCGAAAQKAETSTGVNLEPVSEEADVRSVLSKVTTGNADAGLVYVTDVTSAGSRVQGVNFPEAEQATTNYPIAMLQNAPQPELARSFVSLVTGEQGQKTLQAAGFGTP